MVERFQYTITDANGSVTTRSFTAPDMQCAKRRVKSYNNDPRARDKTYRLIKPMAEK